MIHDMRDPRNLTPAEAEAYEKRREAMMGEWPGPESFGAWLKRKHPDVQLTPMQEAWIYAQERGEDFMWTGGRSSGKTAAQGWYTKYLRDQGYG